MFTPSRGNGRLARKYIKGMHWHAKHVPGLVKRVFGSGWDLELVLIKDASCPELKIPAAFTVVRYRAKSEAEKMCSRMSILTKSQDLALVRDIDSSITEADLLHVQAAFYAAKSRSQIFGYQIYTSDTPHNICGGSLTLINTPAVRSSVWSSWMRSITSRSGLSGWGMDEVFIEHCLALTWPCSSVKCLDRAYRIRDVTGGTCPFTKPIK